MLCLKQSLQLAGKDGKDVKCNAQVESLIFEKEHDKYLRSL